MSMEFKGSMWAWGAFVGTIILVGFLYILFDKILASVEEPTGLEFFAQAYASASEKLSAFWHFLPAIVLLILSIGVIAISVRKKEGES